MKQPDAAGDARGIGVPTFIETAPGSFKPIEECSKGEIAAEIMALLAQAESARRDAVEAQNPVPHTEILSLLYEANELGRYLNV